MRDHFHVKLTDDAIREISSIGLAHLGDAVYELQDGEVVYASK